MSPDDPEPARRGPEDIDLPDDPDDPLGMKDDPPFRLALSEQVELAKCDDPECDCQSGRMEDLHVIERRYYEFLSVLKREDILRDEYNPADYDTQYEDDAGYQDDDLIDERV